jgi:hypothetical protein
MFAELYLTTNLLRQSFAAQEYAEYRENDEKRACFSRHSAIFVVGKQFTESFWAKSFLFVNHTEQKPIPKP